jgi:hypothetical protein
MYVNQKMDNCHMDRREEKKENICFKSEKKRGLKSMNKLIDLVK